MAKSSLLRLNDVFGFIEQLRNRASDPFDIDPIEPQPAKPTPKEKVSEFLCEISCNFRYIFWTLYVSFFRRNIGRNIIDLENQVPLSRTIYIGECYTK